MHLNNFIKLFTTPLALVVALSLSSDAAAQHVNHERGDHAEQIVIRRTIPYPRAVKRSPLTSDRLSTTSTRYIDARRGFRPYSSVYGYGASQYQYAAYDDHFGISRPENRPYSYSQRTPRTYVQRFTNTSPQTLSRQNLISLNTSYSESHIARSQRDRANQPKPNMTIRVHNDRSAIPTTRGAVLIKADGTVIQIGD